MEHQTVEHIPLHTWSWLWMALAEELGPERAAELCGELRYRSALNHQPEQPDELACAVGGCWPKRTAQEWKE